MKPRKTYLLRIINFALNYDLFFSIADHTLTIVEADAIYIKPFQTNILFITPGKTTNVLLKTIPVSHNATTLFMTARPYFTGQGTFDNYTVVGVLQYENDYSNITNLPLPTLPPITGTSFVANFTSKFRSLAN